MEAAQSDLVGLVRAELDQIIDPCSVGAGNPMGLDEMGVIESISIDAGTCTVRFRLTAPGCLMVGVFREACTSRLTALDGIDAVETVFDSGLDWSPEMMSDSALQRRTQHLLRLTSAS